MLRNHFKNAVLWCFSPQKGYESGRRFGEWLFGDRIASAEKRETLRFRQSLIHRQAARAVEWLWDRSPAERKEFIEKETPSGGYLWGVTSGEIFAYSQKHFRELLPKRSDPGSQQKLDDLRRSLDASANFPSFHP